MKHNGTRRHNGWTWGIAGLLAVATLGTDVALSTSADAAVTNNSTGAYGNPARYAPYIQTQVTSDCVEQASRLAMDAVAGHAISHTQAEIDAESIKLGIGIPLAGSPSSVDGSTFDASNVRLFAHYGFKATAPHATSRATVEADLNRGDAVTVTVWAGGLWDSMPDPAVPGDDYWDSNVSPTPDHAVVVESINRATGAVTIGDSGIGASYTVPWATFSAAWSPGRYAAMDVRK